MNTVLRFLSISTVVLIFLLTGIFLYTRWEVKQWEEKWGKNIATPNTQPTKNTQETEARGDTRSTRQELDATHEKTETPPRLTPLENSETLVDGVPENVVPPIDTDLETFFAESSEEINDAPVPDLEAAAVEAEVQDSTEIAKAGFEDYNTHLSSNPEYAYQRLDAAFRAQYGDSQDVDILIQTIRRSNDGTATLNDAIENTGAFLRLASKISPEEGLEPIREHLETLQELKRNAIEEGTEMPVYHQTHVFDPTM